MMGLLEALQAEIGIVRHSEWLRVDQSLIDQFAEATRDRQFIHIDPKRAALTPFGGTVAHGFLTLSLLSHLYETTPRPPLPNVQMAVNYGFDRVRFVQPVRSGSRIRSVATLVAVVEKQAGQFQQSYEVDVEIEGADKPALVATWLTLLFA